MTCDLTWLRLQVIGKNDDLTLTWLVRSIERLWFDLKSFEMTCKKHYYNISLKWTFYALWVLKNIIDLNAKLKCLLHQKCQMFKVFIILNMLFNT